MKEGARHNIRMSAEGKLYHLIILEISKVSPADEGEYRAIARNNLGEGIATINLRFEGKTATDKPK